MELGWFRGFQGDRTEHTVLHANFQPIWWYKTSKSPLFYICHITGSLEMPHNGVPCPMGPKRKAPKKGPKKGAHRKGTRFIDGYPSMNIHWWMSINEYRWISSSLKSSSLKKQWKNNEKQWKHHDKTMKKHKKCTSDWTGHHIQLEWLELGGFQSRKT